MSLSRVQRAALIAVLASIAVCSGATVLLRGSVIGLGDAKDVVFTPPSDSPTALVQVGGAVARPGLYRVPAGARASYAVRAAGGARADADLDRVNLARRLYDGDTVYVPVKKRPEQYHPRPGVDVTRVSPAAVRRSTPRAARVTEGQSNAKQSHAAVGKVNVNTAPVEALEQLPGIGPTIARRIVEHRERYGPFTGLQDLRRVDGIGAKKAAALAPYVRF